MSRGPEYSMKSPDRSSIEIRPTGRLGIRQQTRWRATRRPHPLRPYERSMRVIYTRKGMDQNKAEPVVVMPTNTF